MRSEDKASKIRSAYPDARLSVAIVPDIALPDAFDELLIKNSDIDVVLHSKLIGTIYYALEMTSVLISVKQRLLLFISIGQIRRRSFWTRPLLELRPS